MAGYLLYLSYSFIGNCSVLLETGFMKKPDLLVFLTMIVMLGAAITGMTMENNQHRSEVLISEHSIR